MLSKGRGTFGVDAAKPSSVICAGSFPPKEFEGREIQVLLDVADRNNTVISSAQQLLRHQEGHSYEVLGSLVKEKSALIERMTLRFDDAKRQQSKNVSASWQTYAPRN